MIGGKLIAAMTVLVIGLDGIDQAFTAHSVFGEPRWIAGFFVGAFYLNALGLIWLGGKRAA
jgi:hypothetical protein